MVSGRGWAVHRVGPWLRTACSSPRRQPFLLTPITQNSFLPPLSPCRHVLRTIVAPCMQTPLPAQRVEKDRLSVQYTTNPRHYISDDSLALHYR